MKTLIILLIAFSSNTFASYSCIEKTAIINLDFKTIVTKTNFIKTDIQEYNSKRNQYFYKFKEFYSRQMPIDKETMVYFESLYNQQNFRLKNDFNTINEIIIRSNFYGNIAIANQCYNENPSIKANCSNEIDQFNNVLSEIKETDQSFDMSYNDYLKTDLDLINKVKFIYENQKLEEILSAIILQDKFEMLKESVEFSNESQNLKARTLEDRFIDLAICIDKN